MLYLDTLLWIQDTRCIFFLDTYNIMDIGYMVYLCLQKQYYGYRIHGVSLSLGTILWIQDTCIFVSRYNIMDIGYMVYLCLKKQYYRYRLHGVSLYLDTILWIQVYTWCIFELDTILWIYDICCMYLDTMFNHFEIEYSFHIVDTYIFCQKFQFAFRNLVKS